MNKEYLPSKIFIVRIIFIILIIGIIFGVTKIYNYYNNKSSNKSTVEFLVKDVIQKDSNNNNIPDWEESLWGLDPNKDGLLNKEFILNKRKILAENNNIDNNGGVLTKNDELSRELFSVVMSLQQAGTLNEESINLITSTIGEKIESSPLPDIYTKNMLNIVEDSPNLSVNYDILFNELIVKYSQDNIGDELIFISEGLKNNDSTAMDIAKSISDAYKNFSKDLVKIPVPSSIASIHLSLINNYQKTGQAIDGLSQILDDQLLGMSSILNYKKYNDALVSDIDKLTDSY